MTTRESSREEIMAYQRQLQIAGLYLGSIDGIWGPRTQRASEAYEASQKRTPNASPSRSALRAGGEHRTPNIELEEIAKGIIETAKHFLNLTETTPNARWDNVATTGADAAAAELRQALLDTGWQIGWAYCIAFVEVCWRVGYRGRPELGLISSCITPSVMGTFENFTRLHRITEKPELGAIMLMQHGNTWQGHAGIVVPRPEARSQRPEEDEFFTIEGNTSSTVASREGDGVYPKHKYFDFTPKSRGLWLRGFVNPFIL